MNDIKRRAGCLILCGGRSARMKRDKAKLVYDNGSFLENICGKVRRMDMPRYVSLAHADEQVPADFTALKDEVTDDTGFIGPLGGIYTGLKRCRRDGLAGIFTVPVDLPLFETELFDLIEKALRTDPGADMYLLESTDGRIHPAAGYYSTGVINAIEKQIGEGNYSLMALGRQPGVRMVCVRTENAGQDRMLFNVNTPDDYKALTGITENRPRHIVLQGEKGAGKSTLIRKLAAEMQCTSGGYLTRAVMNREKGYREIFMYPASFIDADDQDQIAQKEGKLCGISMNGVKEVYSEVFDAYGTRLIRSASGKQLIIMDEIGTMEEGLEKFRRAVLSAFDGNVPVIASIKAQRITSPFLEEVRSHRNIQLIDVNEENRDQVYEQIRSHYMGHREDV